jgi:hemolysin activation/secretion protein
MTLRHIRSIMAAAAALCLAQTPSLASQTPADRADPSVIEEELPDRRLPAPRPANPLSIQAENEPDSPITGSVVVGAIMIEGADPLPPSLFAPVIASYAGRQLSPAEMRALVTDIANGARDAGFGLATAWIPPQTVTNGILRVRLDPGRIDAIEAEGNASDVALCLLSPLIDGQPVRTAELERRLLLAGDIAGIWVGRARLERRGERNILHVQTQREKVRGRAYLDNWGSSTVGPVNLTVLAEISGVMADDDQLRLGGVITPFQPDEFKLIRGGYSKLLGVGGTVLSVDGYAAWSRPGGVLSDRDVDSSSYQGSIDVMHPLRRTRASSLWGKLEFALRDATQTQIGRVTRDDRVAKVSASALGIAKVGEGRVRGLLSVVQGTGAFNATREGDPDASRLDGSAIFTKVELWTEYRQPLGHGFSLQIEAQGQLASRPLLSSEEMGLGGRNFLRSYDYREASGDKGIAGSTELRFDLKDLPRPVEAAQLYGYVDAGSVGNYGDGRGGATLASAGGGVRVELDDFSAGLELGMPLNDSPFSRGDRDPRLSFTVAARF